MTPQIRTTVSWRSSCGSSRTCLAPLAGVLLILTFLCRGRRGSLSFLLSMCNYKTTEHYKQLLCPGTELEVHLLPDCRGCACQPGLGVPQAGPAVQSHLGLGQLLVGRGCWPLESAWCCGQWRVSNTNPAGESSALFW